MSFKPLPIGVDNFEKLITSGYYYVDKSLFIKELIDMKSEVNLFTRPRRFGKTLNLSMFKYFFEKSEQDRSPLFQGLKIMAAGEKYTAHLGKYPVISLSLKSAKQPSFSSAYTQLKNVISDEFARHSYILSSDSLSLVIKDKYTKIMNLVADDDSYATALKVLSQALEAYHNQKVIILIDEYDVPLENAHFSDHGVNQGFYSQMTSFIRSLFESALKSNDALEFAVVTGCLRITKESIFTGLNNLEVISILTKNYSEHFGFTQKEVSAMLAFYDRKEREEVVKQWYNGYLFGDTEVYNPWSMINYVKELLKDKDELPKPYWSNTSSNNIVKKLVERADPSVKQEIEALIAGGTIEKPIHEDITITYNDIYQSQDNLWNFLFFTGYLKKTSEKMVEDDTKMITLSLPNMEIRYVYKNTILNWFERKTAQKDLSKLYQAMLDGDTESFTEEINKNLIETISFYDSGESFYQGFLAGLLKNMNGYIITSNRESGKGRYDLLVRTPSVRGKAIILELKVSPTFQRLGIECDNALAQIEEKGYESNLKSDGFSNVMKYGIAFYKKDCLVKLCK